MKRYLARKVIHGGREYGLSIVTIKKDSDMRWHVEVEKFVREVYSTTYHDGTIVICNPDDNTQPYTDGNLEPALLFLP